MSRSKKCGMHYKGKKHSRKHLSKKRVSKKHSRKHLSKKLGRKHRKRRVAKRTRKMRGGFGPEACPFPGTSWNAGSGGNYFPNGTPIGVGGTNPYFGDGGDSPQHPQRGGSCPKCHTNVVGGGSAPATYPLFPQPVVNGGRGVMNSLANLSQQWAGNEPYPSPLPEVQNSMQS